MCGGCTVVALCCSWYLHTQDLKIPTKNTVYNRQRASNLTGGQLRQTEGCAARADDAVMDGNRSSNSRDGSKRRQKCGDGSRHTATDQENNGNKSVADESGSLGV